MNMKKSAENKKILNKNKHKNPTLMNVRLQFQMISCTFKILDQGI